MKATEFSCLLLRNADVLNAKRPLSPCPLNVRMEQQPLGELRFFINSS